MSHFRLYLNNAYIGSMSESFAHNIAPVVCAKGGDVLTLESEYDDDCYYNDVTHTYYMPAQGGTLLCFDHTEYNVVDEDTESEQVSRRTSTKTYTDRLTVYKYEMRGARNMRHSSNYITYLKRDMRRTSRRMGKALTLEQMS